VKVDAEDVIPLAHRDQLLSPISRVRVVEWGQVMVANCAVGVAEAALEASTRFTVERPAFGLSLAHLQGIHGRLADMRTQIDAARLLVRHGTARHVASGEGGEILFMSKVFASDMAEQVTLSAMRLHGAWSFAKEYSIERLFRDAQGFLNAGGANDRLRDLIAGPIVGVETLHYDETTRWLLGSGLLDVAGSEAGLADPRAGRAGAGG
jgi:alkylation response protein AidB-like acyl-CoA dehydrogenase